MFSGQTSATDMMALPMTMGFMSPNSVSKSSVTSCQSAKKNDNKSNNNNKKQNEHEAQWDERGAPHVVVRGEGGVRGGRKTDLRAAGWGGVGWVRACVSTNNILLSGSGPARTPLATQLQRFFARKGICRQPPDAKTGAESERHREHECSPTPVTTTHARAHTQHTHKAAHKAHTRCLQANLGTTRHSLARTPVFDNIDGHANRVVRRTRSANDRTS